MKIPIIVPITRHPFKVWGQLQDLWVVSLGSLHSPNEPMPSWSCQLSFSHMDNLASKKSFSPLLFMAFDLLPSVQITSIISSSLTQWTLKSSCIHLFPPYHGFSDVKDGWPSPFEECRNVLCQTLTPKPVSPSPSEANGPTGTRAISSKPFWYARHQKNFRHVQF